MRILVADDDRQMSLLLCQMLQAAGHRPMPAYDGASAAKLKQSSKTALIPVVVVSATQDPQMHDKVLAMGAAAFLAKPVSPDLFIDAIEAFGPNAKG